MGQRFYRLDEVIGNRKKGIPPIIPVSKASWYAGIKDGRYPRPFRLSERSAAWLSTDIEALISTLTGGA
jgi:prophage regulatory protein